MEKRHAEALKPFSEHILQMYALVQSSTPDELQSLREACEAVTTTNCGWYEYQAAKQIANDVSWYLTDHRLKSKS